ncbi:MAG: transporter [Xanthomonadaceae bacterium]|nr:transporter [Xanthomonadaceae bacterium]
MPVAVLAQEAPPSEPDKDSQAQGAPGISAADAAEVQQLLQELEALKASYASELRRLRELDMQIQALNARVTGRVPQSLQQQAPVVAAQPQAPAPTASSPPPAVQTSTPPLTRVPQAGYAGTAAEAQAAQEREARSVEDVKEQQHALFRGGFTLENGISYNRYDRKQLSLNGFLALDAIFLGNIAIENVESDTLVYESSLRWGVSPRLTLNANVPFIARKTVYQKGGAGGSAAAIAQETTTGTGIGDVNFGVNYKLFGENGWRPDGVLNVSVTAPTGREPYGIPWRILERDDDDFIRFAVPEEQPTGNGLWQANIGMSFVKTTDPAIIFGNIGYTRSFTGSFDDLDNSPDTINPGKVRLGDAFSIGAGVAFAFNERTSFSMSVSARLAARARMRYEGAEWAKVIGSDATAAMFNLGVTHALTRRTTVVGMLGIGLTPDAPDFSFSLKVPIGF